METLHVDPHQTAMLQNIEAARQATQAANTYAASSTRGGGKQEFIQTSFGEGPNVTYQKKGLSQTTEAGHVVVGPNTTTEYSALLHENQNPDYLHVRSWLGRVSVERFNTEGERVYKHTFTDVDAARKFTGLIAKQTARRANAKVGQQQAKAA